MSMGGAGNGWSWWQAIAISDVLGLTRYWKMEASNLKNNDLWFAHGRGFRLLDCRDDRKGRSGAFAAGHS